MSSRTYHCSAGRGDEFYTRPEDVERLMEQYVPYLRDKNILIPCAGDNGPWATYLRNQGCKHITTDPDKHYEKFDFGQFDIVISNIPFSLTSDFLRRIDEAGCEGLVVISALSINSQSAISLLRQGWRAYDEAAPHYFIRPSGKIRQVNCYVLTSFRTNVHEGTKRRQSGRNVPPVKSDQGVLRYQYVADVPERWSGVIAVPISYAAIKLDNSIHTLSEQGGNLTKDGKSLFASLYISCDGSTISWEDGKVIRRSKRGDVVPLTTESTVLLAA